MLAGGALTLLSLCGSLTGWFGTYHLLEPRPFWVDLAEILGLFGGPALLIFGVARLVLATFDREATARGGE